jgi:hypothetical protein
MFGVRVYGADWCEDTRHARQLLERLGVAYARVGQRAQRRQGAQADRGRGRADTLHADRPRADERPARERSHGLKRSRARASDVRPTPERARFRLEERRTAYLERTERAR